MDDLISRQAAIDALWKALYEYEDKTEKQFIDSEELDVADWIQHRIFVQNMSDIDRQTILGLPSEQPEITLESAIDYLHSIGWMQKHDKEMTDSAYAEGYTQAEAKYRAMWDEMQANIKEKAFGKRKGLIHTADIDAMPTIEPERKTGKWINHLYSMFPFECSVCGARNGENSRFCPNCGSDNRG